MFCLIYKTCVLTPKDYIYRFLYYLHSYMQNICLNDIFCLDVLIGRNKENNIKKADLVLTYNRDLKIAEYPLLFTSNNYFKVS